MRKLTRQEIIDLVYGCGVLGTGGGGSLEKGIAFMEEELAAGRELYLADLDELPEDEYIGSPYGCGAPSAALNEFPVLEEAPAVTAFRSLEKYMGKKFCAVASTELGAENTAEALRVAMQLGLPIADGDPAGRSVPELIHSTFYLHNKPIYPFAVATNYGDVAVFGKVATDERAEDMVRAIAMASGDEVLVCDHPMTIKEYKECIIPNAISYALKLGTILRENVEAGTDFAKAIADNMEGKVLFHGLVTDKPWETRDGFDFGQIHLDGRGEFEGHKYRLDYQNEIYATYRDGELDVTVPDLVCMIGVDGTPLTMAEFDAGVEMYVIALPAPDAWKTEKGLEIFGPRHFGVDVDYTPFK